MSFWKYLAGGALGGKLMGSDFFKGSKSKFKKFETMSSSQKKALKKILGGIDEDSFDIGSNKLYKQGSSFLKDLLKPGAMDKLYSTMEAPMLRQFQEEIVPSIAERFSGMGAQSSSAMNQAMGQAGAGLEERLAALKGQLTQQGIQQQLQASQLGLGYAQAPADISTKLASLGLSAQPFGYQNIPGQPGMMQGLMQSLPQLAMLAML